MDKLVNFELAKLLKEKGFNEKTLNHYYDDGSMFVDDIKNSESYCDEFSAPTISETIMWLYEKHEVWICVKADDNLKFKYELHRWSWNKSEQTLEKMFVMLGDGFFDVDSDEFDSPAAAYEAGIFYCLSNLVKEKNEATTKRT